MRLILLLAAWAFFVTGVNPALAQNVSDEDRERLIIHDLADTYGQAFAMGEPDAVVGHMTEDFVALTQGKPPVRGRDAVRAQIAADLEQMDVYELVFSIDEVEILGDQAWASGRSLGRIVLLQDGSRLEVNGTFLWILKKQQDGRWLIHRDSASSSGPPRIQAPAFEQTQPSDPEDA